MHNQNKKEFEAKIMNIKNIFRTIASICACSLILLVLTTNGAIAQDKDQGPWKWLGIPAQSMDASQTVMVGPAPQTEVLFSAPAVKRMREFGVVNNKKTGLNVARLENKSLSNLVPFESDVPEDRNVRVYVVAFDNDTDKDQGTQPEIWVVAYRESKGVAATRIFDNGLKKQVLPFQKKQNFLQRGFGAARGLLKKIPKIPKP